VTSAKELATQSLSRFFTSPAARPDHEMAACAGCQSNLFACLTK